MMQSIVDPEPNNVNQIQGMRVFMRVIELSSFMLAAKQLGMSAAAVTRSINMLEAHLNVRLINRSTRNLSLTEAGSEYLEGCRTIIENLDEIESNLVKATRAPHGTLRIGTSSTFASAQLCALLAAYHRSHPSVDFDIRTFDAQVDMIEGGFDIGFTDSRRLPSSSLVSRVLVNFEDVLVASPSYLARDGSPTTPSMLGTHRLLVVSDGSARAWEFTDGAGTYRVQTMRNTLRASSHAMVRTAAMNHMGIAILPLPLIQEDLERGALVRLLEPYPVNDGARNFSIVYSGRSQLTAKVRTFIDFSVNYFRDRGQHIKEKSMNTLLRAVACTVLMLASVSVFAAAKLTPQQCNDYPFTPLHAPATHAQLQNELQELESVGYVITADDDDYPVNLERAEKLLHAKYRADCGVPPGNTWSSAQASN